MELSSFGSNTYLRVCFCQICGYGLQSLQTENVISILILSHGQFFFGGRGGGGLEAGCCPNIHRSSLGPMPSHIQSLFRMVATPLEVHRGKFQVVGDGWGGNWLQSHLWRPKDPGGLVSRCFELSQPRRITSGPWPQRLKG